MIEPELRQLLALPLPVRARIIARSLWAGIQSTKRRGPDGTFRELRKYRAGDPIRAVDWRASARLDRWMVRETDRFSHLRIGIYIDPSSSMRYARDSFTRHDIAASLLAAVALHGIRQGHAVGAPAAQPPLRPAGGRTTEFRLLRYLDDATATNDDPFPAVQAFRRARCDVILIAGDLFDAETIHWLDSLSLLRQAGTEIRVLQLLHRDELEFPFRKPRLFRPLEHVVDSQRRLFPRDVRSRYLDAFEAHQHTLQATLHTGGMAYHRYLIGDPLLRAAAFLASGATA